MLIAALMLVSSMQGCVRRRMTIRSNPPGAQVYVDNYEIGTTPVSTDFIYYGTRQIRLEKDGYETLTVSEPIRPPWYQIPPLDFFAENVVPGEIRDQRDLNFTMAPQALVPTGEVLRRGEELRHGVITQASIDAGIPASQIAPAPLPSGPMTLPQGGVEILPPAGQGPIAPGQPTLVPLPGP